MKDSRRNREPRPVKRAYDVTIKDYGIVTVRATSEASARLKAASKAGVNLHAITDARCVG